MERIIFFQKLISISVFNVLIPLHFSLFEVLIERKVNLLIPFKRFFAKIFFHLQHLKIDIFSRFRLPMRKIAM